MKAKKLLIMFTAAAGLAVAQTDAKNKIADQISELIETQDAAVKKFMSEVRALPREKQREAYQKGYPQFDDTIEALYALVEESPAEAASLKAISWISSHSRGKELKPEIFRLCSAISNGNKSQPKAQDDKRHSWILSAPFTDTKV